jgi:hypothetical protein
MYTLEQRSHCERVLSARINASEDTWMYGKAVKSRHCPATVCAFAAAPPFCKRVEQVAPDCHEPLDRAIREGDRQAAKSISSARESGDRSRRAL